MQTTPRCLYFNELMRLQTEKKKKKHFHHFYCLLQATKENELSADLNGDTQPRINIGLPDLMSKSWEEERELFVLQVWNNEKKESK